MAMILISVIKFDKENSPVIEIITLLIETAEPVEKVQNTTKHVSGKHQESGETYLIFFKLGAL
jgi:hypothetical protein